MLRSPAAAHPHSLTDQLEYIRRRWGHLLGDYADKSPVETLLVKRSEGIPNDTNSAT